LIIESCSNNHLKEIVRQIIKRIQPLRSWRTFGSDDIKSINNERLGIINAILASENPSGNDHVISVNKLIEEGHACWVVPDNPPVPRDAREFVAAVAPILRLYRHIVFIDPYFDPTKQRFMKPMGAFLYEIWTDRYGYEDPLVELHTSIDRLFYNYECGQSRDPSLEKRACSNLLRNMQNQLPEIIPVGKILRVTIWKKRDRGKKLHNRYIISESCGVAFGEGLDQTDDHETVETDDLHMMNIATFKARKQEYLGNPGAFDFVIPPFEITGVCK
jgi:hypothetical protein